RASSSRPASGSPKGRSGSRSEESRALGHATHSRHKPPRQPPCSGAPAGELEGSGLAPLDPEEGHRRGLLLAAGAASPWWAALGSLTPPLVTAAIEGSMAKGSCALWTRREARLISVGFHSRTTPTRCSPDRSSARMWVWASCQSVLSRSRPCD